MLCVCSKWSLWLLATIRSQQAVRHIAWSPHDPCQAAFICDDGSLHIFTLSQSPMTPAGPTVEVDFPGCVGFMLIAFFTLHALLQCNDVVHDQTNVDSDTDSSGEYVILYTADTALHRSTVHRTWHEHCIHAVTGVLTQLTSPTIIRQAC